MLTSYVRNYPGDVTDGDTLVHEVPWRMTTGQGYTLVPLVPLH